MTSSSAKTIAVITGTRAEFGLLRPVMHAIAAHPQLSLRTIVTGTHLLQPTRTIDEIAAEFAIDFTVPMQRDGVTGRRADAESLGRGVTGLASALATINPDIALVLGDRIEALAGALAAAVSGIRVAHIHGGDRAEGIADESMRHAITKLAHIHLPATQASAQRIITMGEPPEHVHVVGSPSIDGLADIAPMADAEFAALGKPAIIFLMHPDNAPPSELAFTAACALEQCMQTAPTLAMHPNHDPGRDVIVSAIAHSGVTHRAHLPRHVFISLLKRASVLVGNSSAGLIEAAAIGLPVVNIGPRQNGRECAANVIHVATPSEPAIRAALEQAIKTKPATIPHPFGDGHAGQRIADTLAKLDLRTIPTAKRNTF